MRIWNSGENLAPILKIPLKNMGVFGLRFDTNTPA